MLSCDQCIEYAEKKYSCPHCESVLSRCHVPPFHVGDGLGWGTEIFYVCLNDECKLFVNGWQSIENNYGHIGSYRYVLLPGSKKGEAMMVAGKQAFKGSEVNIEEMQATNKRHQQEKEAVDQLDSCVAEKNLEPVMFLILDEHANPKDREKAIGLLKDLNDLSCIDPIRNHSFSKPDMEHMVNMVILDLLKANFKKECPHCSEIIKLQAKFCKHCQQKF
ncbi:MAG: zinc ribbon domain-containing protein [Desulfobulbaceae bacterium]|nr:zinc ribbon domain-containing protein [Desulfobulbaceae bacterium]